MDINFDRSSPESFILAALLLLGLGLFALPLFASAPLTGIPILPDASLNAQSAQSAPTAQKAAVPERTAGTLLSNDDSKAAEIAEKSDATAGSFVSSSGNDSANHDTTWKSWTSTGTPAGYDLTFLDGLDWTETPVGPYVLRTGFIYDRWIAATQFTKDGKTILTEYTPPAEYVDFVDPVTGETSTKAIPGDPNHDGIEEIIFLHRKLQDPNYHMYTVYALMPEQPKLIWKSGGRLGDWLDSIDDQKRSPARVKLSID